MAKTPSANLQKSFFRALNRTVEPLVKAGLGNSIVGPGLFVVEPIGRKSGEPRPVPLLGARLGDKLIVSTVRPSSLWVRNLEDGADPSVWVFGRKRPASATVKRLGGGAVSVIDLKADRDG